MGFKAAFKYAWHGSGRRWDAAPIGLVGGLVGGLIFWLLGLKVPQAILDNPLWGGVVAIVLGAITGVALTFVARLCWWPFHRRLKPHGGLNAFLRVKLGDFMWPVLLTVSGFVAFVLLTGAGVIWLSLQAFDATPLGSKAIETPNTVGNPDFAILLPQGRYRFTWPTKNLLNFYLRLDTERNPDISNSPAFILRNRTNTVAYRVTATWTSETSFDLKEETSESSKLSKAKFEINDTSIIVMPTPALGHTYGSYLYYLDDSPKQVVSVVAKEAEIYLPNQLWPLAAIYLTAKTPDGIGETSPPFIARVRLDWETSEGKRQREYRVRITATNAKSSNAEFPIVDAFLNFSLEEIGR